MCLMNLFVPNFLIKKPSKIHIDLDRDLDLDLEQNIFISQASLLMCLLKSTINFFFDIDQEELCRFSIITKNQ